MMSAESILYSPRGVLDMRVFELDGDKLDQLRTPLSSGEEDENEVPVRSLSLLAVPADDSSSVSSVSLDDDANSWATTEKRTLFPTYWNKKGGRPKTLREEASCSATEDLTVLESCDSEDSCSSSSSDSSSSSASSVGNNYEKLLQKNEATPSQKGRRRRLWNSNVYTQSEPSLPVFAGLEKPSSCLRKTQSTTVVEQRARRPSILRESRYSGAPSSRSKFQRSASERSSVSFCEEVRVKYLKPETERWAAKGWSKYFM